MHAVSRDHMALVRLFLDNGANISLCDKVCVMSWTKQTTLFVHLIITMTNSAVINVTVAKCLRTIMLSTIMVVMFGYQLSFACVLRLVCQC
jgi:hypothetical protein